MSAQGSEEEEEQEQEGDEGITWTLVKQLNGSSRKGKREKERDGEGGEEGESERRGYRV